MEALSPTPNKEWDAANNHITLDTVGPLDEGLSLVNTLAEALQRM